MNNNVTLDCFVVGAVNSESAKKLLEFLQIDTRLNVRHFPAVMLQENNELYEKVNLENRSKFFLLYGRSLLPGEVGCALSHYTIYEEIARTHRGALIIEDDALIKDRELLIEQAMLFLDKFKDNSSILSFYNNEYVNNDTSKQEHGLQLRRFLGSASSTVSYVLTPLAAKILAEANQSHEYLADWPPAKVRFYISSCDVVGHSSNMLESSIGDRSQRVSFFSKRQKIAILSGVYFMVHKSNFDSFAEFIRVLWWPRIAYRLNKMRFSSWQRGASRHV